MARDVTSKVIWVGRATVLPVVLAVMLVLVFGVSSPASAHKGYKGLLHLGHNNAIAKVTTLVGKVASGSALVVKNPSGGSALGLQVNAGQAPLTVNTGAGKATNLDADKLDGQEASAFLGANQKASDSDKLDGVDSTGFYAHGSKVADADKLDGKDSTQFANATHAHSGADITSGTVAEARIDNAIARDSEVANGFVQGRGQAVHGAVAVPRGNGFYQIFLRTQNPNLVFGYFCPQDLGTNGFLAILNEGNETVNVFSDNGGENPNHYGQLSPSGQFNQGAAASGEFITFQVQGTNLATIEVFSVHRENDCHVQGQALVTRP